MYDKWDYARLREEMDIEWEYEFKPCKNVEDMLGIFIRKYENAIKLWIPKIGIRKQLKIPLDKESRKKLRSNKQTDKLWKEFCSTGNEQTGTEYRMTSNQVSCSI